MEGSFFTAGVAVGRGGGDGSGGNASDGEWQHLLLCGPVPHRPLTGTSLRPEGWGPLP